MFFFFQAEDGIRDLTVTGVQTCALPICSAGWTIFRYPEGTSLPSATATMSSGPKIAQSTIPPIDRKSTRLNSSHSQISYAVFCLKKKKNNINHNYHSEISPSITLPVQRT